MNFISFRKNNTLILYPEIILEILEIMKLYVKNFGKLNKTMKKEKKQLMVARWWNRTDDVIKMRS